MEKNVMTVLARCRMLEMDRSFTNSRLKKASLAAYFVIPVKTGIQEHLKILDSRLRGNDGQERENNY